MDISKIIQEEITRFIKEYEFGGMTIPELAEMLSRQFRENREMYYDIILKELEKAAYHGSQAVADTFNEFTKPTSDPHGKSAVEVEPNERGGYDLKYE